MAEGLWDELKPYGVEAAANVVGATETPNFMETQDIHGTGLSREGGSAIVDDLKKLPRTPASVAAFLSRSSVTGRACSLILTMQTMPLKWQRGLAGTT
ncbi:MAG: hypothetical protein FWG10_07170 [Eubacteriaceae bacterium]|nr:hypothetical protein [Eubacteriaceae bacterium]